MVRKPSFDFERRERQKAKAAKRAEKTREKSEKKGSDTVDSDIVVEAPPAEKLS